MAIKNSVQYAKEIAVPPVLRQPDEMHGRVRVARGHYVCATFNNGDTLNLFTLPASAKVIGGYMEQDALAGSTTIALGYAGATDAILAATSTASAGKTQLPKQGAIGVDMGGKLIIATLAGADATDDKVLDVVLYYTVD